MNRATAGAASPRVEEPGPGPIRMHDGEVSARVTVVEEVPSFGDVNGSNGVADPDEWMTVLESAERCGIGRVLYCCVFKRWLDLVIASLTLVALSPLLAAVALAIRADSRGPAIFRQVRIGKAGNPFTIYKFRTMTVDHGPGFRTFLAPDGDYQHKIPDDPRITRVGHVLRQTSLDELPQLLNVVRGEMSLVGPRPELPELVYRYAPWQHRRHLVRPGLTGWWQIHGRGNQPMHAHTELDLYYVRRMSFKLDAAIVFRTFRVVFSRSGAF